MMVKPQDRMRIAGRRNGSNLRRDDDRHGALAQAEFDSEHVTRDELFV
jgi:hypothetical protein